MGYFLQECLLRKINLISNNRYNVLWDCLYLIYSKKNWTFSVQKNRWKQICFSFYFLFSIKPVRVFNPSIVFMSCSNSRFFTTFLSVCLSSCFVILFSFCFNSTFLGSHDIKSTWWSLWLWISVNEKKLEKERKKKQSNHFKILLTDF